MPLVYSSGAAGLRANYPDLVEEHIRQALEYAACLTAEEVTAACPNEIPCRLGCVESMRVVVWLGDKGPSGLRPSAFATGAPQ